MSREETKEILKAIQAYYQNFSPTDMAATLGVWTLALEDYSYQEVALALKSFFKTDDKGFAPVPGQLISLIQRTNNPESLSETEAFAIVMKAIERSSWHSEEEFDKLPPLIKKVVGDSNQLRDWAQMTVADIERVVQPSFARSYRNEIQRQEEYAKLPEEIRKRIDEVNNRPKLSEGRLLESEAVNE